VSFPALFVSHGAPTAAIEDDAYTRALGGWACGRRRPSAALVLSAHAEAPGAIRVNGAAQPGLVYDFAGFPDELYTIRYPAPGDPRLAGEVAGLLGAAGIAAVLDPAGLWDHGVWVPLRLLFPGADVPIVALSLPVPRTPDLLVRVGAALRPLRERGVLLVGSGGIVHNLRRLRWDASDAAPEPWAAAFESWVDERLDAPDLNALLAYAEHAPGADLAVPTSEHFDPLFFVLGARGAGDRVEGVYSGFRYGTLSLRTFALAAA
jgi:4,5-DOPA dioxygenase extradiol